jgi:hypothetical protein
MQAVIRAIARAEDGGEANPSMSPARTSTVLILYFPDSLSRHPRRSTAVVFVAEHNERSL